MKGIVYFDVIPFEVLPNVVRYLAKNPYSENWLLTVKANDALAVLESGQTLRMAAQEMFEAITFSYVELYDFHKNMLVVNQPVLYDKLLNHIAPHLNQFRFPDSRKWLSCNQFRRLRILELGHETEVEAADLVLCVCGNSLTELHVTKWKLEKDLVDSIALHCKALKKLHLVYEQSSESLDPMWEAVSPTLTEVSCSTPAREYVKIAHYCQNLVRLELLNFQETWKQNLDAFAFLINPCTLVLHLDLDEVILGATFEQFQGLLNNFSSKVIVHTQLLNATIYQCESFLRASNDTLRVLSMHCFERHLPIDLSHSLVNLEVLEILNLGRGDTHTMVGSLLSNPLPKLRKLHIYTTINLCKLLLDLGRSVTSLRELVCENIVRSFTGDSLPIRARDFKQFLDANKDLRRIKLMVPHSYGSEAVRDAQIVEIAGLLREIRFYKGIEEIIIYDYEMRNNFEGLRNDCVPMRSRKITVIVNGVRVLPPCVALPSGCAHKRRLRPDPVSGDPVYEYGNLNNLTS